MSNHTIPDHVAARVAGLINAAEDARQQAADDLKQIYADLREELRGMGWAGAIVSAEVAALKSAISELRLDDEKKAKREEKGERVDDYVSMLSRARARKEIGRKALIAAIDVMIEREETQESPDMGVGLAEPACAQDAAAANTKSASIPDEEPFVPPTFLSRSTPKPFEMPDIPAIMDRRTKAGA